MQHKFIIIDPSADTINIIAPTADLEEALKQIGYESNYNLTSVTTSADGWTTEVVIDPNPSFAKR